MNNIFSKSQKIFVVAALIISALFVFNYSVVRADKNSAIEDYKNALQDMGYTGDLEADATEQVENYIGLMDAAKKAINTRYEQAKSALDAMSSDDSRKDDANDLLDTADKSKDAFKDFSSADHVIVTVSGGGTPPKIMPDEEFINAEKQAGNDINAVNRALIAPSRPGNVPTGDIMEDFIPQLIRQLFRFAWLAVFLSLVVSGVYFIIAFDNDDRLGKAKRMIYYSLIGFAFVTLAFAIVKAITDIDFFNFI